MKTSSHIVIILFALVCFSCSNEKLELENTESTSSDTGLVSITLTTAFNATIKHLFKDEKLEKIEYSSGHYDIPSYTDGLISKIEEFDENGDLKWTSTYFYDDTGRLIRRETIPHNSYTQYDIREKTFEYNANNIAVVLNFYNTEYELNASNSFDLQLSEAGLITEETFNDIDGHVKLITYSDNNPISYSQFLGSENRIETSFTYTSEEATEAYHFRQYMFGKEWKNNYILNNQFNTDYSNIYVTSEHLLESYTTLLKIDSGDVYEYLNVTYEFDDLGRITQQFIENNYSNGSVFDREMVYEYAE